MSNLRLYILGSALLLAGCGRMYHLSGHRESNVSHPPDITLRQGDRVKAISTGVVLFSLVPAFMESSNTDLVEIEVPPVDNLDTAYLLARRPGTANVCYRWVRDSDVPNEGLTVTVLPE